jgi:hypothetical protein
MKDSKIDKKENGTYEVGFIVDKPNEVAALKDSKLSFQAIEDFTRLINQPPPKEGIKATPDGKAETLIISFVESKLDEVYLRQWGDTDVHVQVVANEILVWLTLWVIDPQTKLKIERSGFAAVQITVDKVPDSIKEDPKLRNQWALDLNNKKPNACYLSFPKALSMARKNAAQSLGVIFGRNLNRKYQDVPDAFYEEEFEARETIEQVGERMSKCTTREEIKAIWDEHEHLKSNQTFKNYFTSFSAQINLKK